MRTHVNAIFKFKCFPTEFFSQFFFFLYDLYFLVTLHKQTYIININWCKYRMPTGGKQTNLGSFYPCQRRCTNRARAHLCLWKRIAEITGSVLLFAMSVSTCLELLLLCVRTPAPGASGLKYEICLWIKYDAHTHTRRIAACRLQQTVMD